MPRVTSDHSSELARLAEEGRIPQHVADILFAEGCRTIGFVASKGSRWLRLVPGIGPVNRRRLEDLMAERGLSLLS